MNKTMRLKISKEYFWPFKKLNDITSKISTRLIENNLSCHNNFEYMYCCIDVADNDVLCLCKKKT